MATDNKLADDSAASAAAAATIEGGEPEGVCRYVASAGAAALGLYTLWTSGPGIVADHIHLAIFTFAVWALAFLWLPCRKGRDWVNPDLSSLALAALCVGSAGWAILRLDAAFETGFASLDYALWGVAAVSLALAALRPLGFDLALIGFAGLSVGFFWLNYLPLVMRAGAWTATDTGMAAVATLCALEAARRGMGPWIPGIALFAMSYAWLGPWFPDAIFHSGTEPADILTYIFYSQEGIFGIMTSVMANTVLVFIYLGAFMNRSGMGRFFIDLPMAVAGRTVGGPAKVSVISSAVFGSISGSSLANIVSTGTFTIPLMKRAGFRPHVAGAVENSASLGGQLLPPVMGSGAFVMAEITGIPYVEIIAVAAVPALIYLFSIGLIVHFEAKKHGIGGAAEIDIRPALEVLRTGWFHLAPFAVLLGFLIAGYPPAWSAFMAILSLLGINWTRIALAKLTGGDMPAEVMDARGIYMSLVDGTRNALGIGAAAAAVGIIVGMIALTGLGLKMSILLVDFSQGSLVIALILVALASLVLGMALPITASYLVLVVLAAPALEELGVALIAAHMIVFWLSQDSNITPPVCLGAFVAASLAQADPWRTGWASFRFAKMLYVMPLLFAYTPILFTGNTTEAIWTMAAATIGTIAFAAWTVGYLRLPLSGLAWWLTMVAALMCFWPNTQILFGALSGGALNIAGAALLGVVLLWQFRGGPAPAIPKSNDAEGGHP